MYKRQDVYNGFDDDTLRLLDLEVKEVPEMPDSALSVQDMKDYGYAWAGVLPAGQEAAEKALELSLIHIWAAQGAVRQEDGAGKP